MPIGVTRVGVTRPDACRMMGTMRDNLLIGACSWKFPSWHGLVYSQPEGIDYLAEYAQRYPTVEIDQWFWSLFGPESVTLPDLQVAAGYAGSVPGSFRFTIKAPNSITLTHVYAKAQRHANEPNRHFLSEDLFGRFLERIEPLLPQTDAIILQFEYLNRTKMRGVEEFCLHLDRFFSTVPGGVRYAVETRNPNFLTDAYFAVLREHGVAHCFCDGYFMPPAPEVYWRVRELLTGPVLCRLQARDRADMDRITGKQWNRIVEPMDDRINEVAEAVIDALSAGKRTIVSINNHFEGSAPLTIERLHQAIDANCPEAW